MIPDTSLLRLIPYFNGLSDRELADLARYVFEQKAERGDIISFEGEPVDAVYTVVSGVVKTYKTSPEGKEQIFRIARPGDTFNDGPVLGNGINLITAEAMGPVVVLGIKKQDMELLIDKHPAVARNTIRVLAERVQALVSLVEDFSFLNVTGRVAKMLLQNVHGRSADHPRMTQQEMASVIGTAREMVGRSLKNLEEQGWIRMERGHLIIVNEPALRRLAAID